MLKKIVRLASFTIMVSSTAVAAMEAPASMKGGYENKFKWYKTNVVSASGQPAVAPASVNAAQPHSMQPEQTANVEAMNKELVKSSQADEYAITAGPRLSTLGYGVEAGKKINKHLGVRGNVSYAKADTGQTVNGIRYDADLDWLTAGALLDYYPFESSGFRFTGGGYAGDNNVDFKATPSATTTIGNNSYTTGQIGTINGKAKTNMFAPYAGLGYNSIYQDFGPWNVNLDAGVKFNGNPDVALSLTGGGVSNADLQTESARIEDDLDLTKFYPVVGLTVGYRF